jgi:hypothetical protein
MESVDTELIVKLRLPDAPPPGAGVKTVTAALPALTRSSPVMAALSCELLIYMVVREEPFHLTTELEMKFDPVTVNVSAPRPADALVGEIAVIPGTGFCVVEEDEELLLPPPQLANNNVSVPIHPAANSCRNRFVFVFRQ